MKGLNLSPDESEKLIDKYWKKEGDATDEMTRAANAAKKRAQARRAHRRDSEQIRDRTNNH
jgi:hypothetical protein